MGFVDIEMEIGMSAHLFVISREVLHAVSFQEVKETVKPMHSAAVFKAPFEESEVIINAKLNEFKKFVEHSRTPADTIAEDELFSRIVKYISKNDRYDA